MKSLNKNLWNNKKAKVYFACCLEETTTTKISKA